MTRAYNEPESERISWTPARVAHLLKGIEPKPLRWYFYEKAVVEGGGERVEIIRILITSK